MKLPKDQMFRVRTMNSEYQLDEVGLWQNGMLYAKYDEIQSVGTMTQIWGEVDDRLPEIDEMLYVVYLREGVSPRYIRTSLVKEIISNG